ncbi:hypothetical protein AGMMS49959_11320 [Planctomycetales bacterium]|nr:hypothetical protein AGMMS49959_11320 [Planctomycetales bacterium]
MKTWFLLALVAVLSGCGGAIMSQFAGEWGQFSDDRNDVTAVRAGMRTTDILPKIGKPEKIEAGENVYAGWQEWIYPTGSLLVYRGEVKQVFAETRDAETMTKLAKANKKGFELGFESDKKENQKTKEEELAQQEKIMWGVNEKTKNSKYRELDRDGFSAVK